MTGIYEFSTNLQYKVKALAARVALFESGEKYVNMEKEFKSQLAAKDREIRKIKLELADANKRMVTVRKNLQQVVEDMEEEHAKDLQKKERATKAMEERALKAERRVDELKDENLELKRERYARF